MSLAPDQTDRRRTTIRPTEMALEMIAELHAMGFQISEETLEPLDGDERATLLRLLRKII